MPTVSSTVLCMSKFKRGKSHVVVLHKFIRNKFFFLKRQKTLEGVGYVYYCGCDDDASGVCICPNYSNSTC